MNETPDVPTLPAPASKAEPPARPAEQRSPWMPLLALGVVILAGSNAALWWRIGQPPPAPPADLTPHITAITDRLSRLEKAPAPDFAPVLTRLQSLEQKLNRPPAEIDAAPLVARIDALNRRLTADLAPLTTRLDALEQRPAANPDRLQARVEALEQRRISDPVALQARIAATEQKAVTDAESATARIDAIEKSSIRDLSAALGRIAALEQKARDDQRALNDRVELLEKRPMPDLAPIQAQMAKLEQRPIADPRLPDRVDGVSGRLEGLTARVDTKTAELDQRLSATDARLAKVETTAGQVTALAERASRLARLRNAEAALAAGQVLGPVPGAPAALARFADTAPPTEAALRLAFPTVERDVRAAHRPDATGQPLSTQVWNKVQDLVTIRQGDHILIGDDVAGTLARAQTALDAGDLAGAVKAMGTLTGNAAKAAEPWVTDAKALLDARSALATLAAAT